MSCATASSQSTLKVDRLQEHAAPQSYRLNLATHSADDSAVWTGFNADFLDGFHANYFSNTNNLSVLSNYFSNLINNLPGGSGNVANVDVSGAPGLSVSNNTGKVYIYGIQPTIWQDITGYASTSAVIVVAYTNSTIGSITVTNINGLTYILLSTNAFTSSNSGGYEWPLSVSLANSIDYWGSPFNGTIGGYLPAFSIFYSSWPVGQLELQLSKVLTNDLNYGLWWMGNGGGCKSNIVISTRWYSVTNEVFAYQLYLNIFDSTGGVFLANSPIYTNDTRVGSGTSSNTYFNQYWTNTINAVMSPGSIIRFLMKPQLMGYPISTQYFGGARYTWGRSWTY